MGNRAARGANAVSLFPFLAVLICAMGALILLLLVTTRRIRQQQLRESAVAAAKEDSPSPQESPVAEPAETLPPPPQEPDHRDVPLDPLFAVDPPPPLPDPNDAWRERLQSSEAEHSRLVSSVAEQESTVARIRTAIDTGSLSVRELEEQNADVDQQIRDIESRHQQLQQEQSDSHSEAALLRRQIDESRERLARGSSQFTIMPFDGRRGTARRPIIIECTDRGITFVSEGVTLGPDDLEGFNPRYNPLLAATKAITNYWERTDRRKAARPGEADHEADPYVLLVVRPHGTVAYYLARTFLGRMDESFGYELVGEDQEFIWPESDATATEICRSIVEQMLSERESLLASIPGALSDQLGRFGDGSGRFRLDEVDDLRNPSRQITINGQAYRREPAATWEPGSSNLTRSRTRGTPGEGDGIDGARALQHPPSEPGASDSLTPRAGERREPGGFSPRGRSTRLYRSARPLREETDGKADGSDAPRSEASSFARFAQKSRATSPGSTQPAKSHASLELSPRGRSRTPAATDGGQPQWGLRSRAGAIGFEREVVVRVTASDVSVADETAFHITEGLPTDELRRRFLLHLNHHIQRWGEPPRSFYWLPSIKFVISPGGNQYHQRLKAVVEEWKLRCTVERVLE